MSVYADTHQKITSFKDENVAQVVDGSTLLPNWNLYTHIVYGISNTIPYINLILAILMSLLLSIAAYFYIWIKIPSSRKEPNFLLLQTLFWTSIVVMLQINIAFLCFELLQIIMWCEGSTCVESGAISKIMMIGYIVIVNMIVFLVFFVKYLHGEFRHQQFLTPGIQPFLIGIPLLSNAAVIILIIFCICIKPCKQRCNWIKVGALHIYESLHTFVTFPKRMLAILFKVLQFSIMVLPFLTIFTSLTLMFYSLIPLTLQLIVYPFIVLGHCSLFLAHCILFYIAVFLVTFLWKRKRIQNNSVIFFLLLMLPSIALLTMSMIDIPYSIFYILLVSGSVSDNPVVLGAASLLPSLLLSSPLIYAMKKWIIPKFIDLEEQDRVKNNEGVEMEVMVETTENEGAKERGTDIESDLYTVNI